MKFILLISLDTLRILDLPARKVVLSQSASWRSFSSCFFVCKYTVELKMNIIISFTRYSTDYGMFRFCIADTEHDWREGTEQYKFIEHCLASADRQKQPWLIFLAHRVLGYSSATWYAEEGSFEEPMGRESLQRLWQKYKVDIAIYGHVHNYERTCPIYQVCTQLAAMDLSLVSILH